ncbi:MAG: thiamine phosphate synthase [Bacteroidaceae bacterium]|nr:thiamine phosphate synthase [Bacteroidaceae bacterium]
MKKLIVITQEKIIPQEASIITNIIEAGADRVHIRKPLTPLKDIELLLQSLPPQYHKQIVLHDAHTLASHYNVGGLHLNHRHPSPPDWWSGDVSRSCHTLHEIERYKKTCNYLFLSPIHNSISKQGYTSQYTPQELLQAHQRGIIDHNVIALGGITIDNINSVLTYGFGGIAMLGYVWNNHNTKEITHIIKQIKSQLSCYNL